MLKLENETVRSKLALHESFCDRPCPNEEIFFKDGFLVNTAWDRVALQILVLLRLLLWLFLMLLLALLL